MLRCVWVKKVKECPRCHNQKDFYEIKGKTYCRRCLPFKRIFIEEYKVNKERLEYPKKATYHLNYELTSKQKEISKQALIALKEKKHVYIQAVCGAGKTEIVYDALLYYLNQGKRVCFALPRKELAKEIYERIHQDFNNVTMSLVYGGHNEDLEGQLVVCTTHQLYRYEHCFELLIVDEIDAFPYKKNKVLENMVKNACCGQRIMMSATLFEKDIEEGAKFLILHRRYHQHDLPIPNIRILPKPLIFSYALYLIHKFKKKDEPVLVFLPTLSLISKWNKVLKWFPFRYGITTSLQKDNQTIISKLKQGELDFILTSSILERGVTIQNVQVIVLFSSHSIYDVASLIQIAGRVGRNKDYPDGKVYFLTSRYTKEMKLCVKTLTSLNQRV